MALNPVLEASHSTIKVLVKSEVAKTGEVTKACFNCRRGKPPVSYVNKPIFLCVPFLVIE